MSRLAERVPRWITGIAATSLMLYFFAYDLRQRAITTAGADNTEALEIGAQALLDLHDPYGFSTHLGNPIGPLLGGLILALPLYVLMHSLFLLTMLAWACGALLAERVRPRAGLAVVILIASSPWSRATLPYLNDNGITALWIVVFSAWGYALAQRDPRWWTRLIWTAGFACAMDYRWTMWVAGIPYFALFARSFGWRRAMAWLVPVLAATALLFIAPVVGPSGGYRERTLVKLASHSASPGSPWLDVLPVAVMVLVLIVGSFQVRTLAGVFATTSVALGTLLVGMSLLWLPEHNMKEAFYRYHFYWYLGWVLVFGIAALLVPDDGNGRTSDPLLRQRPMADLQDRGARLRRRRLTADDSPPEHPRRSPRSEAGV